MKVLFLVLLNVTRYWNTKKRTNFYKFLIHFVFSNRKYRWYVIARLGLKGSSGPSHFIFSISMSEIVGSDMERHYVFDLKISRLSQYRLKITSLKFRVVICRIRRFPTLILKKMVLARTTLDFGKFYKIVRHFVRIKVTPTYSSDCVGVHHS